MAARHGISRKQLLPAMRRLPFFPAVAHVGRKAGRRGCLAVGDRPRLGISAIGVVAAPKPVPGTAVRAIAVPQERRVGARDLPRTLLHEEIPLSAGSR